MAIKPNTELQSKIVGAVPRLALAISGIIVSISLSLQMSGINIGDDIEDFISWKLDEAKKISTAEREAEITSDPDLKKRVDLLVIKLNQQEHGDKAFKLITEERLDNLEERVYHSE